MNIKTITCHQVYNFGASLQAHALMHYLSELGHDVEVIDYMPDYIRRHIGLWEIGPRWKKRNILIRLAYYCYMVPKRMAGIKSRRRFDDFTRKYLKLTKRYNSFEELKTDTPLADVYFCGSDQIWNPAMGNGLDPAFYVGFAPPQTSIRASYAASFAVSAIDEEYRDFIKGMLAKMDFISVREKTGVDIVENLNVGKRAVNVLDPVFLPSVDHWRGMTYTPEYTNYILVYDQENSETIKDVAVALSKETGKKIIAFKGFYPLSYADIKIANSGPIDFISLIAHADYVVTNSFHCSAFSVIFSREFYVIPRSHQKVNSRMADLLQGLDINGHMLTSLDELKKAVPIDYERVRELLVSYKSASTKFISQVLDSAQENLKN